MHAKKLKMPGGRDICTMPQNRWTGKSRLGRNDTIKKTEMKIDGRKIPLLDIRQELLNKQEKYMWLHTDSELQHMSRSALTAILEIANAVYSDESSDTELWAMVAELERTRTIGIWHDHATVLGQGYVLITAKFSMIPLFSKPKWKLKGLVSGPPTCNLLLRSLSYTCLLSAHPL